MSKKGEPVRSFNMYKLVEGNSFLEKLKQSEVKIFTHTENQKSKTIYPQVTEIKFFIEKVKKDINTGLSWVIDEIRQSGMNEDKKETESLSELINFTNDDVAYGIYFKVYHSDIVSEFVLFFRGRIGLEPEDFEQEYFHKVANEISIDNLIGQNIISPNSEISKKNDILKGNGSNPISDIGDFFESIKIVVSGDETLFSLGKFSKTIEIKENLISTFSKKSSLIDIESYVKNIVKIHSRNSNSNKFFFMKKVRQEEVIINLWKKVIEMEHESEIDETIMHVYQEKIRDILGDYSIKRIINKKDFDEISNTDYLGKEISFYVAKNFLKDIFLLAEWPNMYAEIIEKYILEKSFSIKILETDQTKSVRIRDYLDIWDINLDGKEYYLIAGEWYINDNEFDELIIEFINEQENQEKIVYDYLEYSNLTPYGKDWVEDDYNKNQVNSNPENMFNIDKKLISTSAGVFEISDLINVDTENKKITFYAIKQSSKYISNTKYVLEQAILAVNYLKSSDAIAKIRERYGEEYVFEYEVVVFHKQKNIKSINEIKSFAYKKLITDFILICQKHTINPKVRFINKSEDVLESSGSINEKFEANSLMNNQSEFHHWFNLEIRKK